MKKFFIGFSIIALLGILTACPVSSSYPLGKKGAVALNPRLLGTWVSDQEDIEANQISITKGTEKNTYNLHVDVKGSMFMGDGEDFLAWVAEIKEMKFLVLQQLVDGQATETYYVYHFNLLKDNSLVSNDITLKVLGTDAITSIDAYREEVSASMEMEGFLASEINWTKQ
ncbi:MAG: hypothetical protein IT221_02175 [Fluviicola sp.]|nr:hypothetical protein [Fluviicola sp.]